MEGISRPAIQLLILFQEKNIMSYSILFDHARAQGSACPKQCFAKGSPFDALRDLLSRFGRGSGHPVLFTRLSPEVFAQVPQTVRELYDYHPLSRTAFGEKLSSGGHGRVAVVSAGTADGFVTWEAARHADLSGNQA